ncbi:MAG: PQQ-binding-like beta-propeller repeat protein [Deltaproteobacteria bacterium]|nr:PQQ-binding-like beta-propeller repeat protein [Deltaproteobacteria bacterium]MBW2085259.1 PQQ-binding-like beta-propeller repeat protein [Deltaproteobacteria bacterium]
MNLRSESEALVASSSQITGGWLVCPNCGASYKTPHHFCSQCHYYTSSWWAPEGLAKKRSRWKLQLILAVLVLLLIIYLAWTSPFVPNPFVLFRQPASDWASLSSPDEWTGYARDTAHTRYVPFLVSPLHGRIRWSLTLGEEPTESLPAVADGVLYVGGYFKVLALEAATGKQIWQTETTGPVHSSPVIADTLLFMGLLDGRIMALERSTGQLKWEYQTGNFIFSSPAVVNNILYIGSGDQAIYALSAQTGELIWKTMTEGRVQFAPALRDGVLYVSSSDRSLYSLGAKTGAQRLRFRTYRDLVDAPVVANKLVYFVTREGRLYTIKHEAREVPGQYPFKWIWMQLWLWRLPVPPPPPQAGAMWRTLPKHAWFGFTSSPAVTPEALYLGDRRGWFYARDALKGEPLWEFRARSRIPAAPLVLGDTVYFGSVDGKLYALDRHKGKLLWKLSLGAPINTSPVYAAGLLFQRTEDGKIHAIE